MNYFGARPANEQYMPKAHVPRPAWTYRGARRNAARDMQWPARYRYRRIMAMIRAKLAQMKSGSKAEPATV